MHQARDAARDLHEPIDPILVLRFIKDDSGISRQRVLLFQLVVIVSSAWQAKRSEELGIAEAPVPTRPLPMTVAGALESIKAADRVSQHPLLATLALLQASAHASIS